MCGVILPCGLEQPPRTRIFRTVGLVTRI